MVIINLNTYYYMYVNQSEDLISSIKKGLRVNHSLKEIYEIYRDKVFNALKNGDCTIEEYIMYSVRFRKRYEKDSQELISYQIRNLLILKERY